MSDLISRQEARHALCKAVHKGEDIPCENQTASCLWTGTRVCDFVREIDALPTVQPDHIADIGKKVEGDCISRRAVLALAKDICVPTENGEVYRTRSIDPQEVRELLAVQPDRDVIDDCLFHIHKNISVHTATGGVIAIRYYMEKLYEEIYGEGKRPWWMT